MTMMNSDDLDSNVVGIAAFLYIIADLEVSVRSVPAANNHLRARSDWDKLPSLNLTIIMVNKSW